MGKQALPCALFILHITNQCAPCKVYQSLFLFLHSQASKAISLKGFLLSEMAFQKKSSSDGMTCKTYPAGWQINTGVDIYGSVSPVFLPSALALVALLRSNSEQSSVPLNWFQRLKSFSSRLASLGWDEETAVSTLESHTCAWMHCLCGTGKVACYTGAYERCHSANTPAVNRWTNLERTVSPCLSKQKSQTAVV